MIFYGWIMKPIYCQLSEKIEQYIVDNAIRGRMPGTVRLSNELNVNRVTLIKAMHELERRGVVTICGTKGTFVNDKQNRRTRHRVIGLVGTGLEGRQGQSVIAELNRIAKPFDYRVVGIIFEENMFKENPGLLLNFPVDGLLFRYSTLRREQEELLRRENIPMVSTARRDDCPWLDMVDCDIEAGYGELLRYLKSLGHRRVAFVTFDRSPEYRPYLDCVRAMFERELGRDYDPDLFYAKEFASDVYRKYGEKYREKCSIQVLQYFKSLKRFPTAIVLGMDIWGELQTELKKIGFRIPQDISLAAIQAKEMVVDPNLSAVVYDEREMLEWGIKRLIDRLMGKQVTPGCHLIKMYFNRGATCGPANNNVYFHQSFTKKVSI